MKTKNLNQLKKQYEYCTEQYILKFCRKQGLTFDGWVGGTVGGVGLFGDYTFNFSDILLDINTKQPKGLIIDWQNEGVQAHFENNELQNMNYFSYTKGLRFK